MYLMGSGTVSELLLITVYPTLEREPQMDTRGACVLVGLMSLAYVAGGCQTVTVARYRIGLLDVRDQQKLTSVEEALTRYGQELGCTWVWHVQSAEGEEVIHCFGANGYSALKHGGMDGSHELFSLRYYCTRRFMHVSHGRNAPITPFLECVKDDLVRELGAIVSPENVRVTREDETIRY
jgi:hypothetical protein